MRLCYLLVVCVVLVSADNPGLRIRITDKFLTQTSHKLKDILQKVADHQSTDIHRRMTRWPSGQTITKLEIKESVYDPVVTIVEPNQLELTVNEGRLVVEAETEVENEQGVTKITVAGINLQIGVAFGRTSNKKLTISKSTCEIGVDTVTADVEGMPNHPQLQNATQQWLDQLRQVALMSFCQQMEMALGVATYATSRVDSRVPFFHFYRNHRSRLTINIDLTNDPRATPEYLQFDLNGCISKQGEQPRSYAPAPMHTHANTSRMFYVWISPEMLHSLLRAMHKAHKIYHIVDKFTGGQVNEAGDAIAYVQLKARVKQMTDRLGMDYNGVDDVEMTLQTLDAPRLTLNPGDSQKPISVQLKLQYRLRFHPDEAQETVFSAVFLVSSDIVVKIHKSEKGFPEVEAHPLKFTHFALDSIQGETFTAEQREQFLQMERNQVQKFIGEKLKKLIAYFRRQMNSGGQPIHFSNVTLRAIDENTLEHSFDLDLSDRIFRIFIPDRPVYDHA